MKVIAALTILLIGLPQAYASLPSFDHSCQQNLFKGKTLDGEKVSFCQLDNGNFRYQQTEADSDRPIVAFDVSPSAVTFFTDNTPERMTKTIAIKDLSLTLHLTHQSLKNRDTGKWFDKARVLRFSKGELTHTDNVNIDTLTCTIDETLIEMGIKPVQENEPTKEKPNEKDFSPCAFRVVNPCILPSR